MPGVTVFERIDVIKAAVLGDVFAAGEAHTVADVTVRRATSRRIQLVASDGEGRELAITLRTRKAALELAQEIVGAVAETT